MPLGLACLILLLADHLGSTSLAPDAAGNPIGTFDYSPFGQTSASGTSADSVRPRYTGQRHDPVLDTYRFPARAYDPVTGRFLEVDPKRVNPSPYIYASNNPVNRVDPTGGADRPFILIEYDSFPSFLTSDQVSATVLRFVDLPMSFANAIVDMDTLKALNAAAAENWGSYAEMHPMEILRGPSGNIERNELAYFVFGPNSQREVSSGMFDSLKTLQTFDIGRRFHSEQSGPHYARLFHKNIVVHDTGDRARMANLLRELESSMEPFVRERGEASKYEPRPTKFSGLTREYAREAEIRMRRKLWASEPNSRLTPRQRVENYEHLRSSGLSGRQWIRESPEVRSGWATLLPHPPPQPVRVGPHVYFRTVFLYVRPTRTLKPIPAERDHFGPGSTYLAAHRQQGRMIPAA